MKRTIDFISALLSYIIVPIIALLYVFILFLIGFAELLNYLFNKYESHRIKIITKILQPFSDK